MYSTPILTPLKQQTKGNKMYDIDAYGFSYDFTELTGVAEAFINKMMGAIAEDTYSNGPASFNA